MFMQKQMTGPHMEKDSGGGHYSKARDITPENVHLMEQAWVHRSRRLSKWSKHKR